MTSHKSNIIFTSPFVFLPCKFTQYSTHSSPSLSGLVSKRFTLKANGTNLNQSKISWLHSNETTFFKIIYNKSTCIHKAALINQTMEQMMRLQLDRQISLFTDLVPLHCWDWQSLCYTHQFQTASTFHYHLRGIHIGYEAYRYRICNIITVLDHIPPYV